MTTYTANFNKKFQAPTLPALVATVQASVKDTGAPDTFYVYADGAMVGMFTWATFGARPEFRFVPGVTGPAVEAAKAELLDAERDAYHAAQEAYEQVCLAEALAEMEPGVCTCGAVATWHNPAHFYCVCDI